MKVLELHLAFDQHHGMTGAFVANFVIRVWFGRGETFRQGHCVTGFQPFDHGPQVLMHLGGGLVTFRWIELQCFMTQSHDIVRQLRATCPSGLISFKRVTFKRAMRNLSFCQWRFAGEAVVEHAAQEIKVATRIVFAHTRATLQRRIIYRSRIWTVGHGRFVAQVRSLAAKPKSTKSALPCEVTSTLLSFISR